MYTVTPLGAAVLAQYPADDVDVYTLDEAGHADEHRIAVMLAAARAAARSALAAHLARTPPIG